MARKNLIPNPSFRSGLSGYLGINGAAIELASGLAFYGSEALLVTKSSSNNSGVQVLPTIKIVPDLSYAFSAYVLVPITVPATDPARLVMKVSWLGSTNNLVSESTSSIITVSPGDGWVRLTGVGVAPSGAVVASITVTQLTAGTAGQKFYLDALLFEQSSFVGGYLDNIGQAEKNRIVNLSLTPLPPTQFGGMELNADIALGDLVLNTIDETNVVWVCTDIDGWWGPTEPEIPDIPRGVEDGSYDVTGRYQARIMTLTGFFLVTDPSGIAAARDRLVSAINLVRRGTWLRTNEEPTRASFVRLSGRPMIGTVNARGRTAFSVGLKAADPIKYEWNDADFDGFTTIDLADPAGTAVGVVRNIGTSDVTGVFELEGPMGAGSSVYNTANEQVITLVAPLRGAGAVAVITNKQLLNNVITLTTSEAHGLLVGDEVIVSEVGPPFDAVDEIFTITSVSSLYPYTFSYARTYPDIEATPGQGTVSLAHNDTLAVDTYNQSVSFNGNTYGARSRVMTLVDWIKLVPGDNTLVFTDEAKHFNVVNKVLVSDIATVTTDEAHFLLPGNSVSVDLPTVATLANKSLTNNVVTLTTTTDHGFSVGDAITVASTENSVITNKALTSNVAVLTTAADGGFVIGDSINVSLSTTAPISSKKHTAGVATLGTPTPHAFSVGDAITVSLPTTATPKLKQLKANIATITTTGVHNFSVGDIISLSLSTSATAITKYTSGSSVIITTSAAHGFAVGDKVTINFPTSAVPLGARSIAPSGHLVTLTTSTTHRFSVGDRITVDIKLPATVAVSTRSATTTTCTLTTTTTHNFSVGERITVTGMTARYNGSFAITGVTANTITYAFAGTTETSTAATGSIANNSILSSYNGNKIIETTPSNTTLTYFDALEQDTATTSTVYGTSPVITDTSNAALNGSFSITSVSASGTQFTYTH